MKTFHNSNNPFGHEAQYEEIISRWLLGGSECLISNYVTTDRINFPQIVSRLRGTHGYGVVQHPQNAIFHRNTILIFE